MNVGPRGKSNSQYAIEILCAWMRQPYITKLFLIVWSKEILSFSQFFEYSLILYLSFSIHIRYHSLRHVYYSAREECMLCVHIAHMPSVSNQFLFHLSFVQNFLSVETTLHDFYDVIVSFKHTLTEILRLTLALPSLDTFRSYIFYFSHVILHKVLMICLICFETSYIWIFIWFKGKLFWVSVFNLLFNRLNCISFN